MARQSLTYLGWMLLATLPVAAWAQTTEPEWRVVNVEPAQAVPLVERPNNPFPLVAEEVKPVIQEEQSAESEEQKAIQAQLDGLRQYVEGAPLVGPDMSSIRVGGYMVGPRGGSALLNGRWVKVGDSFKVTSSAKSEAVNTLQMLKAMRDGQADTMAEQMENRMMNPQPVTLKVTDINEKQVDVSDGKQSYILPVPRQRGF